MTNTVLGGKKYVMLIDLSVFCIKLPGTCKIMCNWTLYNNSFQLDSLKKQFEKLKEKGNKRKEELGETSEKVDQVMDNMRRIQTSLDRAADELEMHEPVGTDVAQIKEQQKELKVCVIFQLVFFPYYLSYAQMSFVSLN